jgi:hypothetical protein
MALTLDDFRRLVDSVNFRYFVDPQNPTLLCGAQGRSGSYQFVMSLQLDGRFLQFRTLQYQRIAPDHAHTAAVLRVLAEINTQLRFVKFGWDAGDGEIAAYGDIWLMDAGLTREQLLRVLSNFLPSIDEQFPRIAQTIATGKDPGRVSSGPLPRPDVDRI